LTSKQMTDERRKRRWDLDEREQPGGSDHKDLGRANGRSAREWDSRDVDERDQRDRHRHRDARGDREAGQPRESRFDRGAGGENRRQREPERRDLDREERPRDERNAGNKREVRTEGLAFAATEAAKSINALLRAKGVGEEDGGGVDPLSGLFVSPQFTSEPLMEQLGVELEEPTVLLLDVRWKRILSLPRILTSMTTETDTSCLARKHLMNCAHSLAPGSIPRENSTQTDRWLCRRENLRCSCI
jgi:hypothetical protein